MKWWAEGISKLLVFLSFWYVTPILLGEDRLRRVTGSFAAFIRKIATLVSFLAALYAVGLIAAGVNSILPVDWKFIPEPLHQEEIDQKWKDLVDRSRNETANETSSENGVIRITRSPLLANRQQDNLVNPRLIASVLNISGIFVITWIGRSLIAWILVKPFSDASNPPAEGQKATPPTPEDARLRRYVVIGAWLFAVGSMLDFVKWWFVP